MAKDVPDYALIQGVPGRQVAWVSRHGHKLKEIADCVLRCPESGWRYQVVDGVCRCLDWDEETPLPTEMTVGMKTYDELKEA